MSDAIEIGGRTYYLGCLPRQVAVGEVYAEFGSRGSPPVVPRDQWTPQSYRAFVPGVLDQGNQGACTAYASVQALMVLRAAHGLPRVMLSAGNLYGRINGGVDAGSLLSDAISVLEREGVCTATLVPHHQWQRVIWPNNWKDEAGRYRITEAWDCPRLDQIVSALLHGFIVAYGIDVGSNFRVGTDGWVADYAPAARFRGHAMCAVGVARRGNVWGIETVNSWGETFGDRGFAVVPESYFRGQYQDAWAVRTVIEA